MGNLSKKQINKIIRISFVHDVIKEIEPDMGRIISEAHWVDTPPDMWCREEKELYDKMTQLEDCIKNEVLNIIKGRIK
jgi:hypothetical protein